jgi:membrane fusion protein, multidrug efflux system
MKITPAASAVLACLIALVGCGAEEPAKPPLRPVQTIVIRHGAAGEQVSLSGQIQARNQANLAFRIGGRLIERRLNVGDAVSARQLVARIESQDARNSLRSAEAELAAAQATLVQARNNEQRFKSLVETGVVSRSQYDDARQQLAAAESRVESAQAGVRSARDNVSYTELYSDTAGVVTAKGAEPGEVVQAGQMVLQVAQQGGKDAVFNVPAPILRGPPRDVTVNVALVDDSKITASGKVREVSPQADPTTGTYLVRVGLDNPPEAMRLGSTVVGSARMNVDSVVAIPGTALTKSGDKPAVWVFDPKTRKVSLRPVKVGRYEAASVIVQEGLQDGDIVVTAGVHTLIPGQEVRLLESAS